MRLERLPEGGVRVLEDDEVYLDLSESQYEDIYYAIPLDSADLFMLLNGTVLTEADDCAILTFLCEANGGVDPSMVILQELVKKLKPLKEETPAEAGSAAGFSRPMDVARGDSRPPQVRPAPVEPEEPEAVEPEVVRTVKPEVDEPEPVTLETVKTAPAQKEDEPFEIVVHAQKPPPDPFAALNKPEVVEDAPFEVLDVKPAGTPVSAEKPRDPNRPPTQVFSKKKSVPIEIVIQPDGKRVRITVGSKALDLGVVRYEDMYFAMPGDNASLFRLINDTILSRTEERDAFKDILGILGGVDSGMTAIQNAVLKVEPPPKKAKSAPPAVKTASTPSTRPPLVAPRTTGGAAPAAKPPTVAPIAAPGAKPGAASPPVVAPVAKPGTLVPPAKPAAGPGIPAKPPAVAPAAAKAPTILPGGVKPAPAGGGAMPGKPATLLPGAKPAAPAAAGAKPATMIPPAPAAGKPSTLVPGQKPAAGPATPGKAPAPAGPRPFTVEEPGMDDVELVDDVEEIPTAPVAGGDPGAPLGLKNAAAPKTSQFTPPTTKTPGATPAAAKPVAPPPSPATLKKKGKTIDRPQGSSAIKMTKEEVERTGVKIKPVPNGYQIICKEYFIQLSKAQYQELHYALPIPVMNMFKLVHNDLLKDPGSRGVLMKMIHLAGGPKDFMSALSVQVQAIKPTEDWQ